MGRISRLKSVSHDKYIVFIALLTYTMERHVTFLPMPVLLASFAKNAPSIEMGERLAADRLRLMGVSMSRENPHAKKSASDHKSDCAPVSAMANTSARAVDVIPGLSLWSIAEVSAVVLTVGWALRRARRHSPFVKT
jgi:hypothetical protein